MRKVINYSKALESAAHFRRTTHLVAKERSVVYCFLLLSASNALEWRKC